MEAAPNTVFKSNRVVPQVWRLDIHLDLQVFIQGFVRDDLVGYTFLALICGSESPPIQKFEFMLQRYFH
jgi:hypothetical protein